ncbi:DUF4394 domain-containing protein [uncultured Sphingomonas sp.]|uniref:DUF4394 domain-containing protein n=1 Tax=uncultured Sphingomonas sp. TaxID=158754 RepID=UPI0037494E24
MMAAALLAAVSTDASAATIFGVDENNNLVTFDSSSPGTFLSSVRITGADSSFEALDFRPLNNMLYGLTANRVVHMIDTATGVASAVSGRLAIDGSVFGFDFNPTIDRVRIVSNTDNNYVFNPNDGSLTGAPTTTPLGYASGDVNAGANPGVSAAAYTTSTFGAAASTTQLYVIDTDRDVLAKQNNNGGVLNTVGALGVDLGSRTSFDISGTDAFAFNGNTLYRADLGTGKLNAIGQTNRALFGIAIQAVPEPATWAMMILGFGVVGYSMRRRQATVRMPQAI